MADSAYPPVLVPRLFLVLLPKNGVLWGENQGFFAYFAYCVLSLYHNLYQRKPASILGGVQLLQLTGQDAAGLSAFADLYVYTGNPKYAGTVTAGERELWYTSPAAAGLSIFVR